jgi:predicted nucleotidyltransferase
MARFSYTGLHRRWQEEKKEREKRAAAIHSALHKRGVPIFRKYGIKRAVLFGSAAEGRTGKESDVDLLVMPLAAVDYWQCRHELEEALGGPLDLCTQDDDPRFVRKILSRGEVIYELQP